MTKPGTQPTFSRRVARLLCLVAFAALLLPVAACGRDEPNRPAVPTGAPADDVAATVAAAVAATVAAQATAPPTAAPLPSATPTPPALAGRWRYEHNEEGLHYTDVFEFFDDGLYTARLEGVTSFCREFEDFPGCQAMPDIPIESSTRPRRPWKRLAAAEAPPSWSANWTGCAGTPAATTTASTVPKSKSTRWSTATRSWSSRKN